MRVSAPRVMLAGTQSGCGKTTVTCAVLRALSARGLCVQACKCGPDYLDPQFHTRLLGRPSRNLDLFLGGRDLACSLLAEGAQDADLTVIEGVMGYYDGIAWGQDASSYDLARATGTPVVLVADARGRALSVAAEVAGYARFRSPSQVAGVILNRATSASAAALRRVVERETGVPVLGYLPRTDEARLQSRHLGLVAADEVAQLEGRMDALAALADKTIDLAALQALAQQAEELSFAAPQLPAACSGAPVIAVARDAAFSFYYHDTLRLLERLGARLACFSPLVDEALPPGTCGLYLGGGYPELHARALSENERLRTQLRAAISGGLPTLAECGGFLYLHQALEDERGTLWPMVGALAGTSARGTRLAHFGYVTLTARCDGLLARTGEQVAAHEFHYWQSSAPGDAFWAAKPQSDCGWDAVVATPTLHAGFPHLYLPAYPQAARRFVKACAAHGPLDGVVRP